MNQWHGDTMANEIFISYSRKDFDKVKAIKDEIDHEVEIDCWMDLDGIESGNREFEEVIVSAINNHNTILFMLSPNSMNSKFALRELNYAERKEKRIILVYVEPCQMTDRFVFRYDEANTIDWQNPLQHNKLIADLRKWFKKDVPHEKSIQELAEEGNAEAQYKKGCDYFYGGNFIEASKWFLKAANQGHVLAQSYMGWLYEHGEGFILDYEEALKWYKKAAEQGDIKSQNKLGYFYSRGNGVKQDYIQSAFWYRKAAEQGSAEAQYVLAQYYKLGTGVKQDATQAVYWYKESAEQGNELAQYALGVCYEVGTGVEQDRSQAFYWYSKAAERGHTYAQMELGYCYQLGLGVKQDYTQAVYWFRKSAEQGNEDAINWLKKYCVD